MEQIILDKFGQVGATSPILPMKKLELGGKKK
jgi:hypothetical protein